MLSLVLKRNWCKTLKLVVMTQVKGGMDFWHGQEESQVVFLILDGIDIWIGKCKNLIWLDRYLKYISFSFCLSF